jgi:hypothetical protein
MVITYLDDAPKKKSRITYLDDAMSPTDNSLYNRGGDWDLKKRLGSFSSGPKIAGVPLKERLLSGVQAGIPAMVGGAENVEDVLPALGQTAGNLIKTSNPFVGAGASTAGAMVGQAARQGVKASRGFKPSLGDIPAEIAKTGIPELLFRGAGKALEPAANTLMLSVAKPSRDVVKANPRLGLDVLDQGVWGSKERMASRLGENIDRFDQEARGLVQAKPGNIDSAPILSRLDRMKPGMKLGLKADDVSAVDDIRHQFISNLPTKTVQESRQFVLPGGVESKLTTPRVARGVKPYVSEDLPPALLSKTTYRGRPDPLYGPAISSPKTVVDPLGMSLEQGLDMKKAIYAETPDAAFRRSMSELPGKTEGRRAVSQEINAQLKNKVPGMAPLLKKEAAAINYRDALRNRIANETKNVPVGKIPVMGALGSAGAGASGVGIGIMAGNLVTDALRSGLSMSGLAKALYSLSKQKTAGKIARLMASEALRQVSQS